MDAASVTRILCRLRDGESAAAQELYEVLYAELRERALRIAGSERDGTIQATALVHEAWLKLKVPSGGSEGGWNSRAHFLGVAAKAMRSVLVDHARASGARGRGRHVLLDDALALYEERAQDVVALNDALDELARMDERMARIVELRFFGGLSIEETADALEVGHATVERGWKAARAWLRGRIGGDSE